MNRRNFLKTAAVATTASTIAAPAIAQPTPELHWRMALSWPKSLDTLFGACEQFAKRVAELTDNKFRIQLFAAGEIVPGLQVLDAVQNGTVEAGNTGGYYYWGKDPSSAFPTAVPFGLNTGQAEACSTTAADMSCSMSSMPSTIATASQVVIRVHKWVVGSARNSTPLTISRASKCGSAVLPVR